MGIKSKGGIPGKRSKDPAKKPASFLGRHGGLTGKQQLFVREFVRCGNATRAAELAGYSSPEQAGPRLLNKDHHPAVAEAVEIELEVARRQAHIDGQTIINDLAKIARLNPKECFNEDGTWKSIHDMPDHVAFCVKDFQVIQKLGIDGQGKPIKVKVVNVKMYDKMEAFKQLALMLGILNGNAVNINNNNNNTTVNVVDWAAMCGRKDVEDVLEARIAKERERIGQKIEGPGVDTVKAPPLIVEEEGDSDDADSDTTG